MYRIVIIFELIKIIFKSIFYRKKVYLVGTPVHGNLGDQAILYAEEKIFKEKYPKYKLIEIQSGIASRLTNLLKVVIKKNDIYIHGGGFLGNLWMREELMFRRIVTTFNYNKIVVLPQTIFFTNDDEGKKEYVESKRIYEAHNNLLFILREEYSYKYMKEFFPKCKVQLCPDMVLYLNKNDFNINIEIKEDEALFCIRKDLEKINYNFDLLKKSLIDNNIKKIKYTDTVIGKRVYKKNRKQELSKKISEFTNSKIIITDRLHGMIFALISEKPCLVFENKSYKILGVFKWINNNNYIILHDGKRSFDEEIKILLSQNCNYNNEKLKKKLIDMI